MTQDDTCEVHYVGAGMPLVDEWLAAEPGRELESVVVGEREVCVYLVHDGKRVRGHRQTWGAQIKHSTEDALEVACHMLEVQLTKAARS